MSRSNTTPRSTVIERHATSEGLIQRCMEVLSEVISEKQKPTLLLPAGATPKPFYAELRHALDTGTIDLGEAHLFQLDEIRGVPRDDPRSFQAFLQAHLLGSLKSSTTQHLIDGAAEDPDGEIHRHAAALEKFGGADLAFLGIGPNGHIAFNGPGSDRDAPARRVRLAESTRAGMAKDFGPDELPEEGLTLGVREILQAKKIVLMATGSSKASILKSLVQTFNDPDLPASFLAAHPNYLVLCDEQAGKHL